MTNLGGEHVHPFKLLHKKINLGGEHDHLFKLMNLEGAGLIALLILALLRGHLLN
jgi:hypothetical protein